MLKDVVLPTLPDDVQHILKAQLLGAKEATINYEDALITLQLVLAKMQVKQLQPRHMAWESLAAGIALLADTSPAALKARARCGFSHRELYFALEQDMLGYNCGKSTARRFARCLPCAVGKPGKCGSGSAAWFCRRRLSVLDTRDTPAGAKSDALRKHGGTLLPNRSDGHALARGLTAAGEPCGLSRKCTCPPPGPEENDLVSMFDRMTWSDARLKGMAAEDDKSETFVAQARTLLESAEGMTAPQQWDVVNIATTKRYTGNLKRLAGKDSNKRKIAAHADGEAAPATKADLQSTELKRWPDYDFLIGVTESDTCLPEDLRKRSACFLNDDTRAWAAEMQPAVFSMPPWHIRSGQTLRKESTGAAAKRQRVSTPRASAVSASSADELSTVSLRTGSVPGFGQAQAGKSPRLQPPADGARPAGAPQPVTPELSSASISPPPGAWQNGAANDAVNGAVNGGVIGDAADGTTAVGRKRQRSPSVPRQQQHPTHSGSNAPTSEPPSPHTSIRKTSVSSLDGRSTAARDLLSKLVPPPQGGPGGPLHHTSLLPDPSQLSSAFAGSFSNGGFGGGFGNSGFGGASSGGNAGFSQQQHLQQQVAEKRPPLARPPTGGKGVQLPPAGSLLSFGDALPPASAAATPSAWGSFGAGSLAAAGDGFGFPTPGRRSMRVDLGASDPDSLLRTCSPSLPIHSLQTGPALPPPSLGFGGGGLGHGGLGGGFPSSALQQDQQQQRRQQQPAARHGSLGDFGSGFDARSSLAAAGFGSTTSLASAGFGGDRLTSTDAGFGGGFGGTDGSRVAQGQSQLDSLSAWRMNPASSHGGGGGGGAGSRLGSVALSAGPGPSAGMGPSWGGNDDEAGPSSGAGPSHGGATNPTPADDNAIFDGYLDDLLTFDELLMPMDGFGSPGRPESRGAGPAATGGGHCGGALGEDLGGLCSNCWGKEEGCPECQRFLEELLMPSDSAAANPAAFAA